MIERNLPALVVLLPLFGGLFSIFCRPRGTAWLLAVICTLLNACAALWLFDLVQHHPEGFVEYFFGGWPAEYGIAYRVDVLNASVITVVAVIGFLTTLYAGRSIASEVPADQHPFFYSVWLLALCGMIGITATGDSFNVYVLLEISALTVYTLIAMGRSRNRRALTASLKYLVLGSIGATFLLLGIGYLLMMTGTLNMADMHQQLLAMKEAGTLEGNRTMFVALAFLGVGLALKMALFPMHMWLPDAYTYAPSAVSAMVSATATKVGVYMAFRFLFTILGDNVYDIGIALDLFIGCACLGVLVSSLRAIMAKDVKRVLAYSSIGQLSYIVLGFALSNREGVTASVIHIFNHAMIKGGMFMAIGCVVLRVGGSELERLRGLGRRMPWTMGAFTAGGLGLVGMPLTSGFVSKWYLLQGAVDAGLWSVVATLVVGSLLALIYVWRMVEIIYFHPPDPAAPAREAPLSMLLPTCILIAASIYFGVDAERTGSIAGSAANLLLGGGP